MSNLVCDNCGGQIKKGEGRVTFLSHQKGKMLLKDFILIHMNCDNRRDTEEWADSWIAENILDLKHIILNLNDYGDETEIEGKSLVRVLAQFYQGKETQ